MSVRVASTVFGLLALAVPVGLAHPADTGSPKAIAQTGDHPQITEIAIVDDPLTELHLAATILGAAVIGQYFFRPREVRATSGGRHRRR